MCNKLHRTQTNRFLMLTGFAFVFLVILNYLFLTRGEFERGHSSEYRQQNNKRVDKFHHDCCFLQIVGAKKKRKNGGGGNFKQVIFKANYIMIAATCEHKKRMWQGLGTDDIS